MAVCTTTELATAARCYICLDDDQLEALKVFATYREALALGYVVDASVAAIAAIAQCGTCLDAKTIRASEAQIAVTKANLAGAALPTDVSSLANLVRVLRNQAGLESAYAQVLCLMKAHQTFP